MASAHNDLVCESKIPKAADMIASSRMIRQHIVDALNNAKGKPIIQSIILPRSEITSEEINLLKEYGYSTIKYHANDDVCPTKPYLNTCKCTESGKHVIITWHKVFGESTSESAFYPR